MTFDEKQTIKDQEVVELVREIKTLSLILNAIRTDYQLSSELPEVVECRESLTAMLGHYTMLLDNRVKEGCKL